MNFSDTIKTWENKCLEGKRGVLMAIEHKGNLYCFAETTQEEILTLYVLADYENGISLVTYDKYISDEAAPMVKLLYRENEKEFVTKRSLVLIHNGKAYPFGINEALLAESEEVEHEKPIRMMMVYFRTKHYHTFFYCDREHGDVRRIEELASLDREGKAVPDAITTCTGTFLGAREQARGENSEEKMSFSETLAHIPVIGLDFEEENWM